MDDLVASAVSHWGPRFTMNGVTAADFTRITASIDHWNNWCATWVDAAAEHESLGRAAIDEAQAISAGEHLARAAVYYHFAKFVYVVDVAQMRAAHARAVACLTDALPYLSPPGRRIEIPFEDAHLVGVLRLPPSAGPHPVVVLIPGLDSTKEELGSTERTFLDRGLATLSIDGPGQGESEYHFPIRGDWAPVAEAIWDTVSGISDLDRSRLGVWGVSLGGYYAPRVAAALGPRAKACVALSGPFNMGECWEGLPQLTRDTFRVRSGAGSEDEARSIAMTLGLDAVVDDIEAPVLQVIGSNDRLIPVQNSRKLMERASSPFELLELERGNHGCANVAPWHRPRTADWLAARLGAAAASTTGERSGIATKIGP